MSWLESAWDFLVANPPHYVISTYWILVVTVSLILCVAFSTLWERKVIGWMQLRKGPNRVGSLPFGILPGIFQPFADVIKLLLKEVIIPSASNKVLFRIAPMITLIPAFAIWAVVPLDPNLVIADVNAGLLYVLALTSVGVYGVILAGWASNSKYAFLGAMRSAALETRHAFVARARELEEADRQLARLARGRSERPSKAPAAGPVGPDPGWAALLSLGFLLALAGFALIGFVAVQPEGGIRTRPALLGVLLGLLGAACWTLALFWA